MQPSYSLFSQPSATAGPERYITFDVDIGGFNNIRMQFEFLVVIAAITGRTLVLPPAAPWYLINWGPIKREADIGGVCSYEEFFDINALRRYIKVISTADFIQQQQQLEIPSEFTEFTSEIPGIERAVDRRELRQQWKIWLANNARLMPWNPLHNLVYYPDISAVMNSTNRPDARFIDSRTAVCFDAEINKSPVLYFPADVESGYRQLGQLSRLVAFADEKDARGIRMLLKQGLRYAPQIFSAAQSVIDQLGIFQYSSLHLRRNDFQFHEFRADPATTAANIGRLLKKGEPLYLATDETEESFFDDLRRQREVIRFADLSSLPTGNDHPLQTVPHKLIGCVEQLICAGGRVFAGTPHSSFSTYISRVRGYLNAPDLDEHCHTQLAVEKSRQFGFIDRAFRGTDYLREDPVLWEDADLEQPIYSVSCTDVSDYAHWQCELLEYSWKQVGQTGELIRLVSREKEQVLPTHLYTQVIPTLYTNTHPQTGDYYVPYNRLFSFQEWLDDGEQHGTVLILDPDCVFRKRINLRVQPGKPLAQRWGGFLLSERWLTLIRELSNVEMERIQGITWPALVHTDDLRRLMPRWIELTSLIRQRIGAWESDMLALVIAAAELGLHFSVKHLAAVMNWPEQEGQEAPIVHYCQAVQAKDGSQLWFKQGYQPWQKTAADPAMAQLPYCADLIAMLNEFIETKTIASNATTEANAPGDVSVMLNSEPAAKPSSRILVRAFLRNGEVAEFNCERGDETMHILFQALANNTASASGNMSAMTMQLPVKEGMATRIVQLAKLVALETIPLDI